jgi:type VI secretion system protein ImpL
VAGTVNLALNEKWKAEVWQTYSEKIAPRYPFNKGSQNDVTIAEFAEFFRPGTGTLWAFFNANLTDRLVRAGTSFTPKSSADQVPFTGSFLQCLQVSQIISDAVFGAGAEPLVPFQVRLEPAGSEVSEVNLSIDGQAIVYRNEPERPFAMQWPGKGANRGGILKVVGAGFTDTTQRGGDFGWFRLLWFGNPKPVAGGLVANYPLSRTGQPPVTITIRPDKTTHPFTEEFFARLNCPPAIMSGGSPVVAPR